MQKLWCSKLLKYYIKKGQIIRHFLFLAPYTCFLFDSLKLIRQFSPRFDQICLCSKLFKYYNKKGQIIRRFLLFLASYIHFLFESLKQTVFSKIQPDIWMLKIVEIFQHFSKKFTQLKIFLVHHQCFLSFFLAPKEFFEQNQLFQLFKSVKILHQNFNFNFVCNITVPQWRRKKLLLI